MSVYCNAVPNRYVYVDVGLEEIVLTHFMHCIIVMVVGEAAAVH